MGTRPRGRVKKPRRRIHAIAGISSARGSTSMKKKRGSGDAGGGKSCQLNYGKRAHCEGFGSFIGAAVHILVSIGYYMWSGA